MASHLGKFGTTNYYSVYTWVSDHLHISVLKKSFLQASGTTS